MYICVYIYMICSHDIHDIIYIYIYTHKWIERVKVYRSDFVYPPGKENNLETPKSGFRGVFIFYQRNPSGSW